jgi:hypothetical protein
MLRLTWALAAEGVRRALGIRSGMEVDDERAATFHRGVPPGNKGLRYPLDPPTVE